MSVESGSLRQVAMSRGLVELGLRSLGDLAFAVVMTDLSGVVTGWNEAASILYGFSPEEAMGASLQELIVGPVEQTQMEEIWELLSRGLPWAGTLSVKRRGGGHLAVNVVTVCVIDENGDVCGVVALSREEPSSLEGSLSELRELRRLVQLGDEVRTETAREIAGRLHDDLSQRCHHLLARTYAILEIGDVAPLLRQKLEELMYDQEDLVRSLQNLWRSLRPPLLDEFGAHASIEQLATEAKMAGSMAVDLALDEEMDELSSPLQELIVLIVQEGLSNVVSHAKASHCSVTVNLDYDSVVVEVTDNGVGFEGPEGFGLRLMRERVQVFGGFLSISDGPSGGTSLIVELEQEWTKSAPLESLIDPHVVMKALRDEEGTIVDFVYTDANDAALAYNQTSRSSLVGSRLLDLLPGHRGTGLLQTYVDVIETGAPLVLNDFVYPNEILTSNRRYDIRAVKVGDSLSYTWRDVTDRYELDENYRLLVENVSDVVYRLDLDGILRWISPSVERVLGWHPEELLGKMGGGITHPADEEAEDARGSLSTNREVVSFELRLLSREGTYRWCRFVVSPIMDMQQNVVAWVGSFRDVDEERRQAGALAESEERFRLLAENSVDVISVANGDGRIEWMSGAVTKMLGWQPVELVHTIFDNLLHPDDLATLRDVRAKGLTSESVHYRVRLRTKSGVYRWIEVGVRQIDRFLNLNQARVASWRDVHDEVEAENVLQETETLYRIVAEHASDVVLVVDGANVIRWASPSVERILGWRPTDVVGRPNSDFVFPDDLEHVVAAREDGLQGQPMRVVTRLRHSSGSYSWFEATSRLTKEDPSQPLARVISIRSIEAETRIRAELKASEEQRRLLSRHVADVVYEYDEEGVLSWISPSVTRILGWEPSALIGTNYQDLIHPDDRHLADADSARVLRGETGSVLQVRFRTSDGGHRWMSKYAQAAAGVSGPEFRVAVGLQLLDQENPPVTR